MRTTWPGCFCALILPALALSVAAAQARDATEDAAFRIHTFSAQFFATTVARAGDMDHDGVEDYAIGGPSVFNGRVFVYSGATGVQIRTLFIGGDLDFFGYTIAAAGDVNGDEHGDLAIGAPLRGLQTTFHGEVSMFSGIDGQPLWNIQGSQSAEGFGWSVASVRDVNGDGVRDLAIGAPFWDDSDGHMAAGRVLLVSGASGAALWQWSGGDNQGMAGLCVAGIGDVNGDGVDDVAIGMPGLSRVTLVSGTSGATIDSLDGGPASHFGYSMAALNDVNGDGVSDFAVGAFLHTAGGVTCGAVRIISGATRAMLRQFTGSPSSAFGISVSTTDDLDGDGALDVIIGAPNHRVDGHAVGHIEVRSTGTGLVLKACDGPAGKTLFGDAVAGIGDVDGDGLGDLLVGRPTSGAIAGAGYVFSSAPHEPGDMRIIDQPGWTAPARTILADLDRDGAADLVTIDEPNDRLIVRMSNADGNGYLPAAYISPGRRPSDLVFADLDHDGDLDMVVALRQDNALAVYSNGAGILVRSGTIAVGRGPSAVVAADFDHDGRMDLAVANRGDHNLMVLRQTPHFWAYLYRRFQKPRIHPLSFQPTDLLVARLDGNNLPDLLAISRPTAQSAGLINLGQTHFTSERLSALGTGGPLMDLARGDFNGDGVSDLAVCDGASTSALVSFGLGNGAFGAPIAFGSAQQPITALCSGDLDNNALDDLACAQLNGNQVMLLLMQQDGDPPLPVEHATVPHVRWLASGDLDGDHDRDILALSADGAATFLFNRFLDP